MACHEQYTLYHYRIEDVSIIRPDPSNVAERFHCFVFWTPSNNGSVLDLDHALALSRMYLIERAKTGDQDQPHKR